MRRSLTAAVSVAFVGGLAGRALDYGFSVVVARGLGPGALGVVAFGLVAMKVGGVLAQAGLDSAVQRFVPVHRREGDDARLVGTVGLALGVALALGTLLGGALFLAAGAIGRLTSPRFGAAVRLFALGVPPFAAMMVGAAATRGFTTARYSVYARDLLHPAVAFVAAVVGAYVLGDLRVVVLGYVASLVAGALLAGRSLAGLGALRADLRPRVDARRVLGFSLPLTLAAVSLYLVKWTDVLVLGAFVRPAAVGWYQAAYQTSVLLAIVLQSANAVFPSLAADLYHDGRRERLARFFEATTKWVASLTVLGTLFVALYARDLLALFGTATPAAVTALLVLAVGQAAAACAGPVGFLLMMSGHERLQTANALATAAANVALNLALVPRYGVVGAAVATGLSLAAMNVARLVEARYLLGMVPYSRAYWRGAVAVAAGGAPLVAVRLSALDPGPVRVVGAGALGLLAFGVVASRLGLDEGDRLLLEALD